MNIHYSETSYLICCSNFKSGKIVHETGVDDWLLWLVGRRKRTPRCLLVKPSTRMTLMTTLTLNSCFRRRTKVH